MFTLAISSLTTSKLPWFMDLTFQVPMQYCPLQHHTLLPSPVKSTTGCCVCFGCLLILSGVIFPLISSSILDTDQPAEFFFQCPTFLPFHTVHGVLKAIILKWFAITVSSGPRFVRTLHRDPSILGGHTAWLSFIELDEAVVLVIWLASCLCLGRKASCLCLGRQAMTNLDSVL